MRNSLETADYTAFPDLGLELLQARFRSHRYIRHSHDSYAIGVTEEGVQSFWCRGQARHGVPGSVLAINPGEVHDGQSGTGGDYAYFMFYVSPTTFIGALEDLIGRPVGSPSFVSPLLADAHVSAKAHQLRLILQAPADTLEQETARDDLLWSLSRRYIDTKIQPAANADSPGPRLQRVKEYLHAYYASRVSLQDIASTAGMSRFRLNACFLKTFGLPPHAYLTQLRLRMARTMLEAGEPIAEVATSVGFVDQSHLTRSFRACFGVTPGMFQSGRRTKLQ